MSVLPRRYVNMRHLLFGGTVLILLLSAAGCGVPGPDGPADSYGLDLSPPKNVPARDPYGAVVFLVDGLNGRVFEEMLAAGELPAFRRYFADQGLYAPRAVANIPSVTLPNLASVVTGRFCGRHGVLGVNWLERQQHLFRDYHTLAQKNALDGDCAGPMLYEYFPGECTVSIFCQPHRGATKFFENWLSAGPPFVFGWYEFVDRIALYRFGEMMETARRENRFPRLVCTYLLAPDFLAYQYGIRRSRYRDAIRHADRQIGRVLGDWERAGVREHLVLAVVSDHSHSDVQQHLDLTKFFETSLRLDVPREWFCDGIPPPKRQAYYDRYAVIVAGSGDRYRAVYLRAGRRDAAGRWTYLPWAERPRFPGALKWTMAERTSGTPQETDLETLLLAQPGIDAVAWATAENQVRVATKKGVMEFFQPAGKNGPISGRVLRGEDPLGYEANLRKYAGEESGETGPSAGTKPAAQPGWLSSRQWLEATHGTNYPDLPPQILAYFQSSRAADAIVFAAPGWDFGKGHRGGHGGIRAEEDMHVPLLLAGPGVPHGRVEVARTVDLAPTLLQLLGRSLPDDLDGCSLLPPVGTESSHR